MQLYLGASTTEHIAIDIRTLLVKGFRNLVAGEDDELATAYSHFHKMVDQENSAVRMAILTGVEQLKQEGSATNADVKGGLVVAERIEQNTKTVMNSTGRVDQYLESKAPFRFKFLHSSISYDS